MNNLVCINHPRVLAKVMYKGDTLCAACLDEAKSKFKVYKFSWGKKKDD